MVLVARAISKNGRLLPRQEEGSSFQMAAHNVPAWGPQEVLIVGM